jgi:hypothetical protein
MVKILHIVEIAATLASSLVFSCLSLLALAKFAIDLALTLRGQPLGLSSQGDVGSRWIWPRDRLKIAAELFALLATSALFFWLSYALARRAMAPML